MKRLLFLFLVLSSVGFGQEVKLGVPDGHKSDITAIYPLPKTHLCLTTGKDFLINLWNTETGKLVNSFKGHKSSIENLELSYDNSRFITTDDSLCFIWDISKGTSIKKFDKKISKGLFATEDIVILQYEDTIVDLYSIPNDKLIRKIITPSKIDALFSLKNDMDSVLIITNHCPNEEYIYSKGYSNNEGCRKTKPLLWNGNEGPKSLSIQSEWIKLNDSTIIYDTEDSIITFNPYTGKKTQKKVEHNFIHFYKNTFSKQSGVLLVSRKESESFLAEFNFWNNDFDSIMPMDADIALNAKFLYNSSKSRLAAAVSNEILLIDLIQDSILYRNKGEIISSQELFNNSKLVVHKEFNGKGIRSSSQYELINVINGKVIEKPGPSCQSDETNPISVLSEEIKILIANKSTLSSHDFIQKELSDSLWSLNHLAELKRMTRKDIPFDIQLDLLFNPSMTIDQYLLEKNQNLERDIHIRKSLGDIPIYMESRVYEIKIDERRLNSEGLTFRWSDDDSVAYYKLDFKKGVTQLDGIYHRFDDGFVQRGDYKINFRSSHGFWSYAAYQPFVIHENDTTYAKKKYRTFGWNNSVNLSDFNFITDELVLVQLRNKLELRSIHNWELLEVYKHHGKIESINFNEDSTHIVSSSLFKHKVRNIKDKEFRSKILALKFDRWATSNSISPKGNYFIKSNVGEIRVWNVHSEQKVFSVSSRTEKKWWQGKWVLDKYEKPFFNSNESMIGFIKGNFCKIHNLTDSKLVSTISLGEDYRYSYISCAPQFLTNSNKLLVPKSNGDIELWNTENTSIIGVFPGNNSKITQMIQYEDKGTLLTISRDGAISLWDLESQELLIKHYYFDQDPNKWVQVSKHGYFDAPTSAHELLYLTKGTEVIDFSQVKDRLWKPGLWEMIMNGSELPSYEGLLELKQEPDIQLGSIQNNKLPITLTKREGGYGKIAIYLNDKELSDDIRDSTFNPNLDKQTIYYTISDSSFFKNGKNTYRVVASSSDGTIKSRGTTVDEFFESDGTYQPQFFGVLVGIGDYLNPKINLNYTTKDANTMEEAFKIGAENLFPDKTHIYSINSTTDKKPNKENIKSIFDDIQSKATAEDIIVVYLSGHGITWGGDNSDFYFLTSDAVSAHKDAFNDSVVRSRTTISTNEWVEWLNEIPALKQVMIIDACGSGKAVDNLLGSRDLSNSQVKIMDRMKDRTGMFIITGCAADKSSYEANQFGHGLLTYSLLEGMKGGAPLEDKMVNVQTILNYAQNKVPELAETMGVIQSPQVLIPKSGPFYIGKLEQEDQDNIPLASPKQVFIRSSFMNTATFEDDIDLSVAIDEKLYSFASKGSESQFVFIDTKSYSNACKLSGGYEVNKDKTINLHLRIRCGNNLQKMDFNNISKAEAIEKILGIVQP
jgi:hypothetical protein